MADETAAMRQNETQNGFWLKFALITVIDELRLL